MHGFRASVGGGGGGGINLISRGISQTEPEYINMQLPNNALHLFLLVSNKQGIKLTFSLASMIWTEIFYGGVNMTYRREKSLKESTKIFEK